MQSVNKAMLQAAPMYFLHIVLNYSCKEVEHFLVLGLFLFVLAIYIA